MSALRVETLRGSHLESVHHVSAAVVDVEGRLMASSRDPRFQTFLRSAAKPFQAIPVIESGAAAHFALTPADLALVCASHNSEPEHVQRAASLLSRIGCSEQDLACGPHRPLWRDLALPSQTRGLEEGPRTRTASNCSGKHAGMLAWARHAGWPTAGYERADHPVQQRCREEVARWAGLKAADVPAETDGCGVQCFALPLDRMARAFAAFAVSDQAAPRAIMSALTTYPHLVAGRGRLCTALMETYPGTVMAKVGAEGVYGAALPQRGLGIAVKVEDGHGWSAAIALLTVLEQLDLEPPPSRALASYAIYPLKNTRGEITGSMRAAGSLTFV